MLSGAGALLRSPLPMRGAMGAFCTLALPQAGQATLRAGELLLGRGSVAEPSLEDMALAAFEIEENHRPVIAVINPPS